MSEARIKEQDEVFCFSCGEAIKQEAEICPKCGVRQQQIPSNTVLPGKKIGWSYFADAVKKYVVFAGRSRRAEFWWYTLCLWVIEVFAGIIGNVLFGNAYLVNIVNLAFLVPSIAVFWRRMHDVGKPGGYCFIPIYDLILAIQAGDKGSNNYGPDPKELS
jgi:uncharacterized membrane protein YhaH (DUF805 family)